MSRKFIIAVHAPQNHGKTSVINEFWDILCTYPGSIPTRIHLPRSPRTSAEVLGYTQFTSYCGGHPQVTRIGVNSRGDDMASIVGGLLTLLIYDCDIIVCACRNEWKLIEAINSFLPVSSHLPAGWVSVISAANGGVMLNPAQITNFQSKILSNGCEFILYSHFCDIPDKTKYMGGRRSLTGGPTPRILRGTSIDLNKVSAQNIDDLVKELL